MKKVVVLKIEQYDLGTLKERIKETIYKHFPLSAAACAGEKILLKPNFLMEAKPEEAIVTHPIFIEAVGAIFKEMGYPVFIADSPGGFIDNKKMDFIYTQNSTKDLAQNSGFTLLYPDKSFIQEGLPFCWWSKGFRMINLPKLKTHDIMILTLAVKNLYGCISGLHKSHLHKIYTKTDQLSLFLLKLYKAVTPSLNIVDGILALEGNGPAKTGKPKKLGVVVVGDDALYTDYAIGRLLGLEDKANPLIRMAKKEGLLSAQELELISEISFGAFKDFKFPASFIVDVLPKPLVSFMKLFLKFKPAIDKNKCTGCLECLKICPNGAMKPMARKAEIDYSRCLVCMCCQEVCRQAAIDLDKGLLLRIAESIRSQSLI